MNLSSIRWTLFMLSIAVLFGVCGCRSTGGAAAVSAGGGDVTTGYQPIQSELIYSVNYDAAASMLTVVLYEDGVYDYTDVPKDVYDGLLKASDRDQYYRETIKSGFKGKKFTME